MHSLWHSKIITETRVLIGYIVSVSILLILMCVSIVSAHDTHFSDVTIKEVIVEKEWVKDVGFVVITRSGKKYLLYTQGDLTHRCVHIKEVTDK